MTCCRELERKSFLTGKPCASPVRSPAILKDRAVCNVHALFSAAAPPSLLVTSHFLGVLFSLSTMELDQDMHTAWFAVILRAEGFVRYRCYSA